MDWWDVSSPGEVYHDTWVPQNSWWGISVLLRAEELLGCVIFESPCFGFALAG